MISYYRRESFRKSSYILPQNCSLSCFRRPGWLLTVPNFPGNGTHFGTFQIQLRHSKQYLCDTLTERSNLYQNNWKRKREENLIVISGRASARETTQMVYLILFARRFKHLIWFFLLLE